MKISLADTNKTKVICVICVCVIVITLISYHLKTSTTMSFTSQFTRTIARATKVPTIEQVHRILRDADAICFDVDSTVCTDEAIDELASFCGVGPEVAECTMRAMGGGMTFRDALKERLNIMQPSISEVKEFIATYPPRLSHNIRGLVDVLKAQNKQVFLVSGGFRVIIAPVAAELDIPLENIFANRLLFNEDGSYSGFDTDEPTSQAGGKAIVVQHLKDNYGLETVVFIGDGATDLEASPPADVFIGYGGNVVREKVKNGAAWFVTDFKQIIDVLTDNMNS